MIARLLLILSLLLPTAAFAVQPDEMLQDPALEARAREISKGLRCLVCRNESIDDSNADLARDLRIEVRTQITEGKSNDEVVNFLVDKYGEYVLLKPRDTGSNRVLYLAGPGMLIVGLLAAFFYLRRRSHAPAPLEAGLNSDEAERLDKIMKG
ncbi:cytochrome c-type biogenesis protein [Rhodalgimonas zhirmunskyi]|uniref:Cytochrome c-type biogenesis protein n=1 Tax=Rhodalgimonas zhirmunskyi TaxID=2964767 RepID=A0AAJ1UAC5_9RHOB|nr:cytochrome c-type biogenesis protein [Rhodoalgimonas zhirmunskyi]MDQ2092672.1 cytochrome c-type biogenesis protein CcmH [Rhodoalgimonas zhirmunskyi]